MSEPNKYGENIRLTSYVFYYFVFYENYDLAFDILQCIRLNVESILQQYYL